ncbi:MAG: hypothetical protein IPL53_05535 [Ignavibacteria bacterium]|nr:hypothetical protein [Ignavibacteria bacterium]
MIYKALSLIKVYSLKIFLLVFTASVIMSCENNPNEVGITFISSDDTLSTRILDSQLDSMAITNNNYKKYINTSNSPSILVGNYQSYTSKSLLKFSSIDPDFDSAVIVNAKLTLRYNDYFFSE